MANKFTDTVFEIRGTAGIEKLVLWVLAHRANKEGKCWPSYETIAKDAGVSRATAIRCVKRLEKAGLLLVARGGNQRSNVFQLRVGSLAGCGENRSLAEQGSDKPSKLPLTGVTESYSHSSEVKPWELPSVTSLVADSYSNTKTNTSVNASLNTTTTVAAVLPDVATQLKPINPTATPYRRLALQLRDLLGIPTQLESAELDNWQQQAADAGPIGADIDEQLAAMRWALRESPFWPNRVYSVAHWIKFAPTIIRQYRTVLLHGPKKGMSAERKSDGKEYLRGSYNSNNTNII